MKMMSDQAEDAAQERTKAWSAASSRWPLRRDDSFAGLDIRHHDALIHSLPGVIFWPLLLWGLAMTGGYVAVQLWSVLGAHQDGPSLNTMLMLSVAGAYGVLAVIFWIWLAPRDMAHRVYSLAPRGFGDIGIAVLMVLISIFIGGQLAHLFYEFASLGPDGFGISGEDPSNVDDILAIGASQWAMALALVIAAPLVEEAIFRGWMLPMMVARGVPWVFSILITSVLFGLMHIFDGLHVIAYTTILGALLGVARMVTGRLAAPVLGHALNNAWALFATPYILSLQQ